MNMKRLRLFVPLLMLLTAFGVSAQAGQSITPGSPVSGQLDADNFTQVFTIDAQAGQTLTVSVVNINAAALALTLTDATGAAVAQAVGDSTGNLALAPVTLTAAGTYYITVFNADGLSSAAVPFTLTAQFVGEATEQPSPDSLLATESPLLITPEATSGVTSAGQILTTTGMTINLNWTTTDDLDLEVRDPVGGSLYFQTPTVPSGGTLGPNVNQGCAVTTQNAAETGTWSPGGIPTGSYELLVYYQQACDGENPVAFTLEPIVDGTSLGAVTGTLLPGQIFVTSFVIDADATAVLTNLSGIVEEQILPDSAANILSSAVPTTLGALQSGTLTTANPYDAYNFTVEASDVVTITMNATSGSLDTFLLLLDAQGNIVRSNDDLADGITNSQINNALLTTPGVYTIVATRYGKRVGGTEGDYSLQVNAQANNLPAEFFELPRGSLEFTLFWNTDDDLQLLVRDPAGDALYDDQPQIRSGGALGAQGNVNCTPAVTSSPFSYAYWPQTTALPRPGVYEIEVWFQNDCGTINPVEFNLFATYQGSEVFNVSAQPIVGERYLISFTLEPDGRTTLSDGGIIRGLETLPYQAELENAVVLNAAGGTANGTIAQDNKFDVYVFEGEAGDLINVAMNATSGTLDPTLYIVGPFNNVIAENDDAVPGENRNSLISNLTLPETGQYIIIATHFGALYGGTTGTYSLSLTVLN
ncbi:MAG: PPC domain-containing protein [bacterium]|nr:PPC domain-containing protein [bacterium]